MSPKQQNNPKQRPGGKNANGPLRNVSRGAAIRAQKRSVQDANRKASQYLDAASSNNAEQPRRANAIDDSPRL
jgi:hypothetical protein